MQYKKLNNRVAFELYLKEPMKLLFRRCPHIGDPYLRDINTVLAADFAEGSGWEFFIVHEPFTAKVTLDGDSAVFAALMNELPEVGYNPRVYYEVTIKELKEEEE